MIALFLLLAAPPTPVVPLQHAHSHNDYAQAQPLQRALGQGFTSVEADIFLVQGQLRVGHHLLELRPGRTLEALYLEPLRRRVRDQGGKVYADGSPFYLLIDLKSAGEETYQAVHRALANYSEMLTTVRAGKCQPGPVTVIISGNIPRRTIERQPLRLAAIDGRPPDLDSTVPVDLIPMISTSWASQFRWRGEGPMPEAERTKLRDFVARAHQRGRLVRFWATPEKPALWRELRAAGVDLINTDRLDDLRRFLLDEAATRD
ncbi:MAG: phosphatidylinositol-specific phospholipase C/glycerophosphodiester phosphodiesterase family protein [Gemmataceae bacterium]